MPRKTRAAAKAEDPVFADIDAPQDIALPPTPKREREPLRSITPNSVDSLDNERVGVEEMAKPKGKKGKKAAGKKKGKKDKVEKMDEQPEMIEETAEEPAEDAVEESPDATAAAKQEPAAVSEPNQEAIQDVKPSPTEERPASSLGRSSRMTRRQQTKVVEERKIADEEAPEPKAIAGELVLSPPEPVEADVPTLLEQSQDTTALSPTLQELPDRTKPEPLSLVASNATSRRTSQVEDPIEAIDLLEDEIDEVSKIIPNLDSPLSPVKPKRSSKMDITKPPKPATAAKGTVTRANKLATTTQPSATARVRALAEPRKPSAATTLSRSASTKTRPTSVIEPKTKDKEVLSEENGKPVDYLAVKRRPISMQFPTPPPPPKSKKPTTTSNFTLPGEAVAAKLKASRVERQKREEEEAAKKREFKARPVPTVSDIPGS
jgi:hypothetical protein